MPSRLSAVALGAAAVLTLALAGIGTAAYWSDAETVPGTTLRSGSLDLLAGSAAAQVQDHVFTALDARNAGPGSVAQAPLTLRNAGTEDLRYRLDSTVVTPTAAASAFTTAATLVSSAASCPATGTPAGLALVTTAPLGSATSAYRNLQKGSSEVWCIRVTLSPSAPQATLQSTSTSIVFRFRAEQL